MKINLLFRNQFEIESEILFKEHFGRMSYFAFQFVNDQQLAEDLVQDAFVSYWSKKNEISSHPNAVKDFLYTSIRHSALNFIKRQKVQQRYFTLKNDEDFGPETIVDLMIETEVMANLHHAISQLPERCRDVFHLAYFEGLNNSKIAEKLGISINTVRNHKQNGLKTLRAQLDVKTFLTLVLLISRW